MTIDLQSLSATTFRLVGRLTLALSSLLPLSLGQQVGLGFDLSIRTYGLRIPGHQRTLPLVSTQARNSKDSRNQRPVPSWRRLRVSFCLDRNSRGQSDFIIARSSELSARDFSSSWSRCTLERLLVICKFEVSKSPMSCFMSAWTPFI